MKTKKLELKKEVIAALNNDAMARVLGGDLAKDTKRACDVGTQGAGCDTGSCVAYSKDPAMCPRTEWDTCDCAIRKTEYCLVKTENCLDSDLCFAITDTCP